MKSLFTAVLILLTLPSLTTAQSEPPNGLEELEAYSVFVDAYRTDDYQLAMDYGEWMIEANISEISGYDGFSLERHYDRMINVFTGAAEGESDPTEKTTYLEKAEDTFISLFETFEEDEIDLYEWNTKMGRFYHENHNNMDASMDDAIAAYEKMYEMDAERFTNEGDGFFAQVLLMDYASQENSDKALAVIDEIEAYASVDLQQTIDEVRESLFDSPEERIEFLESRIAEAEGSELETMLQDLADLYEETEQTDKAAEIALQLYDVDASFVNTKKVADLYIEEGNYDEAVDFLLEAEELAETEDDRKQVTLQIAETYQQLEEIESARDYTQKAIDIDSDWGEAYIRMASVYAAGISQCTGGSTLEREDRTVYWLVLDYLDKAKEADPSLASNADSRAESYSEAMPSSEDKFFSDWEEGDSFEINGELSECYAWVNETTTIR